MEDGGGRGRGKRGRGGSWRGSGGGGRGRSNWRGRWRGNPGAGGWRGGGRGGGGGGRGGGNFSQSSIVSSSSSVTNLLPVVAVSEDNGAGSPYVAWKQYLPTVKGCHKMRNILALVMTSFLGFFRIFVSQTLLGLPEQECSLTITCSESPSSIRTSALSSLPG